MIFKNVVTSLLYMNCPLFLAPLTEDTVFYPLYGIASFVID